MTASVEHFDVVVIGAGISGIAAGYHLQDQCPNHRYTILEGREDLGGTWDLFQYPGIRSDSDMHTLGFSFRPWREDRAIADGPSIKRYLRETAREHGIDRKIRFQHWVERAEWSSADAGWRVEATHGDTRERAHFTCRFLFVCGGYYDYEAGYTPELPGIERFRGSVVHPQKWNDDVDYADKRVVMIGSGATAVTLLPELAKNARHVTMLQRSPTYIAARPSVDTTAKWLRRHLPQRLADHSIRWKNILYGLFVYRFSRRHPRRVRKILMDEARQALGPDFDVETHLNPRYEPWDQRVCLDPDGVFFRAIRNGEASIVTDRIETFTEQGIRLASGRELDADLVVTATGLNLKFLGGLDLSVDGRRVNPPENYVYKGMMLSDVPNLAWTWGYVNASWTLKCELTCAYVCRLLNHMDAYGYTRCVPRSPIEGISTEPILDLNSGYILRALDRLPKRGAKAPWKLYQNYLLDLVSLRGSRLEDGVMEFSTPNKKSSERGAYREDEVSEPSTPNREASDRAGVAGRL